MDAAILADTSKSMNDENRRDLVDILSRVVDKLGVSSTSSHIGLVTFDSDATVINTFAEKDYQNANNFKRVMSTEISQIPEHDGTRTDFALDLAVTKLFTKEGGYRDEVGNVMIVFTDGLMWVNSSWDHRPIKPLDVSTKALEVIQLAIWFKKCLKIPSYLGA